MRSCMPTARGVLRPLLLAGVGICASPQTSPAQSYVASGQIGYLHEWEIKASLARTETSAGTSYDGPVSLRHTGLYSANGIEEKAGVVQLKVLRSGIEGTLTMPDDSCRIVASASLSYTGLMNCRSGQGVPIHFSIDAAASSDTPRL